MSITECVCCKPPARVVTAWGSVYIGGTTNIYSIIQPTQIIAGNFRGAKYSWLNIGARIFYPRMKRPYLP